MSTTDPRTLLAEMRVIHDAALHSNANRALGKALAALTDVLDRHKPEPCEPECGQHNLCAACWDDFPCPTVQALTAALEVEG